MLSFSMYMYRIDLPESKFPWFYDLDITIFCKIPLFKWHEASLWAARICISWHDCTRVFKYVANHARPSMNFLRCSYVCLLYDYWMKYPISEQICCVALPSKKKVMWMGVVFLCNFSLYLFTLYLLLHMVVN